MHRLSDLPRRSTQASSARLTALACALATVLAGGMANAQEAAPAPQTWYAQAYNQGERGFLVTHLWSKGPKLRSEIVVGGHRVATIVSGEYYYIVDEVTGTGAAIRRAPAAVAEDSSRGRPFAREVEELKKGGAEKVGIENFGGMKCELYRITNTSGRRSVCAGIDPPHLPVQIETYNRATGSTDTLSYVNWVGGLDLPDSFFEPDARIELERVEYADYTRRATSEAVGPAPVLYGPMLHGVRNK